MFKISFILLALLFSSASQARQSCDWPFRTNIIINEESNNTIIDYTVSLTLTGGSSGNLHSDYDWSSSGQDLRIFNSGDNTELEFHIDSWDQGNKVANVRVLLPTLNSLESKTIYVYYGNNTVPSGSSNNLPDITYVDDKIKFHTRFNTTDTTSLNHAKSLFDNADDSNNQYGCSHPNIFSDITNSSQGTNRSSKNFIAYSQALFTVNAGENGDWGVRYGADYGHGGGLYVDGIALDERWDEDLWWSRDWTNPDVLSGSITLTPGEHTLEIIGAEGGNDGGLTIQFKKPGAGASWELFDGVNTPMRSESCPVVFHTLQYGSHDVCSVDLKFNKFSLPNNLNINQTKILKVELKNDRNALNTATSPITVEIQLPDGLTRTMSAGDDWLCSGTSGLLSCIYNKDIIENEKSSELSISILTDRNTADPAVVSGYVTNNQYDDDATNDSDSDSANVNDTNIPAPAVSPSCTTPTIGIWSRFFDIQSFADTSLDNAADFQSIVDDRVNVNYLDGQSITSNINGTGNPFDDRDDDYYLTLFEGYISAPEDGTYTFGVDGDDAIEVWIDGIIGLFPLFSGNPCHYPRFLLS